MRQWSAFVLVVFWGCAAPSEELPRIEELPQAIIYGEDDRLDVYEHPDPALRELARTSVVALVRQDSLHRPASGRVSLPTTTLQTAYELCSSERFLDQPIAADCSGVLIDDDLVLTAAHCFDTIACPQYAFVFDYFYADRGRLETVSASDVYNCKRVLARKESSVDDALLIDFAVVQLDRPVSVPRKPVKVRTGRVVKGEALTAIGFPSGLPAKIDTGAHVIEARDSVGDYFSFDSDTFRGSSGSGVFDDDLSLVGVLVRGGDDYTKGADGLNCYVPVKVNAEDVKLWEEATYASRAIAALCAMDFPSETLCDLSPSCGDGFCTSDELSGECPADCGVGACETPPCAKTRTVEVGLGMPDTAALDQAKTPLPATEGCAVSVSPARSSDLLWPGLLGLLAFRRRRPA